MEGKIAVLIPCYNESKTIEKVVKDYKAALPEADIYVYDNNSKDKTACDHENTGIYFDIDNVEKINYKEYPILIAVFCR